MEDAVEGLFAERMVFDTLKRAARLASWAPDDARDLLAEVATANADELAYARAAEVFARICAVTGAWQLGRGSYATAAASWEPLDPARAMALRAIAGCLPVAAFRSERESITSEIDLVRRIFDPDRPAPVVQRAVVELRRAVHPRPIAGVLERTCGLAPGELAFVIAAAAPIIEPGAAPVLSAADWAPLLGSSSLDGPADAARVIELGLVRVTPELVAHPGVVSRLLGRTAIDQSPGVRLHPVEPGPIVAQHADELARELALDRLIAIIVGPPSSGRMTAAATILARRGLRLFAARAGAGASASVLREAAVEARLHGALIAIDLDEWRTTDLDATTVRAIAPLVITAREEPPVPIEARAFTLRPVSEVSSTR